MHISCHLLLEHALSFLRQQKVRAVLLPERINRVQRLLVTPSWQPSRIPLELGGVGHVPGLIARSNRFIVQLQLLPSPALDLPEHFDYRDRTFRSSAEVVHLALCSR